MKCSTATSALLAALVLAGCASMPQLPFMQPRQEAPAPVTQTQAEPTATASAPATTAASPEEAFSLTILHINDHHSHLDPVPSSLRLRDGGHFGRVDVPVSLGGFARVVSAMEDLGYGRENVIRLHAGDAITGTPYYTLERGRADADLMNLVCFDAFAVGNHEFDAGDTGLREFVDHLWNNPSCRTPVLSANVEPHRDSPLRAVLKPSTVVERGGHRIGIVGLTVADKTMAASRPDPGTVIVDEVRAAQRAIDALRNDGVNKIIVLSHVGYRREQALARQLSGVDVIVGGDSHSLLGDVELIDFGLPVSGPYPTITANRDGERVCIVQAWQYAAAVGELNVRFDPQGRVRGCSGQPHVLIGLDLEGRERAQQSAIRADLATRGELRQTQKSEAALAVLAPYRERLREFGQSVIAEVDRDLCMRRVPGSADSRSKLPACVDDAQVAAHGGDVQQIVAAALLAHARSYAATDFSLINAGGVRIDLPAGPLTVATAHTLLPFPNTLVRLSMTGAEVRATLEDALASVAAGNTGAYPYATDLRWNAHLYEIHGLRAQNVERRVDGEWVALEDDARLTVITHDYLADGRDGWNAMTNVRGERRDNTGLGYAEAFIAQVRAAGLLTRLPADEYSTREVVAEPEEQPGEADGGQVPGGTTP